jgi:hypothetical protein
MTNTYTYLRSTFSAVIPCTNLIPPKQSAALRFPDWNLLWMSRVPAHVIRRHLITGNAFCKYMLWSSLLYHFLRPCIASCHAAPHVLLNNRAELIIPCVRCHLLYYFYDNSPENCTDIYLVKKFFIVLENGRFFSCVQPDNCNFPDLVQGSSTSLPYIHTVFCIMTGL